MAGDKTKSLFQYYKTRAALDAAKEGMPAGAIAFLEGEGNGVLYFKASGTEFKIPAVVNGTTSDSTANALSAAQGKALNGLIAALQGEVNSLKSATGDNAAAKIQKLEKTVASIISIQQTLVLTAVAGTPLTVTPGKLETAEDGTVKSTTSATIKLNVKEGTPLKVDGSSNLYVDNSAISIGQGQVSGLTGKLSAIDSSVSTADSSIKDIYTKLDGKVNTADTSVYTKAEKEKLNGIAAGAQVNVIESIQTIDPSDGESAITATISGKTADITGLIDARVKGEQTVKGVKADDKILTLGTDGMLSAAVSLAYESQNIILKDKAGKAISTISAAPFIKDGMLENVKYDASTKAITFTWNTDSKIDPVTISLKEFIDTYVADETTITLDKTGENPTFKVKDGVFVKKADYDTKVGAIDGSISSVKTTVADHGTRISSLETASSAHETALATLNADEKNAASVKGQIAAAKAELIGNASTVTDSSINLYGVRKYAENLASGAAAGVSVTAEGDDYVSASGSGKKVTVKATDALKTAVTNANNAVRSVTAGSDNGTISVNTGGKTASVTVKGLDATDIMAFEKKATYATASALATTNSNVSSAAGRVTALETALTWYIEE